MNKSTTTNRITTELGYGVAVTRHPSGTMILSAPHDPWDVPLVTEEQMRALEAGEDVQIDKSPRQILIDETVRELIEVHHLQVDPYGWSDPVDGRQALMFH